MIRYGDAVCHGAEWCAGVADPLARGRCHAERAIACSLVSGRYAASGARGARTALVLALASVVFSVVVLAGSLLRGMLP